MSLIAIGATAVWAPVKLPNDLKVGLGILLFSFAYWSVCWHFHELSVSEPSAAGLAAIPFIAVGLYLVRNKFDAVLVRIGKVKAWAFELEFEKAVQQVANGQVTPVGVDQSLFARLDAVEELSATLQAAIVHLRQSPVDRRALYLRLDLSFRTQGAEFSAAGVYLYILFLREAVRTVNGELAGILFWGGRGSESPYTCLVSADLYISELEARFSQLRTNIDLRAIRAAVSTSSVDAIDLLHKRYLESVLGTEAKTPLMAYLMELAPHLSRLQGVDQHNLRSLVLRVPDLIANAIEHLLVFKGGVVVAVIPVCWLEAAIAKSFVDSLEATERRRFDERPTA